MVVVDKKIVIEIAAHLLCRIHGRIKFKFLPIGKRRKNVRQHGGLDIGGRAELRADALLFGCDPGKVIRVFHDTVLHGSDLMVEIFDLVVGPDVQTDHVILRISFSVLGEPAGSLCKLFQRAHNDPSHKHHGNSNDAQCHGDDKKNDIHQEPAACFHHFIDIQVHPDKADDSVSCLIRDRYTGCTVPARSVIVDCGRDLGIVLVGFEDLILFFGRSAP